MATQSTSNFYPTSSAIGIAQVSVGNPNRDGTGSVSSVVSAGSSGTRVDWVRVKATGTTTAGMVRLYLRNNFGAMFLVQEIAVEAVTPSGSSEAWSSDWYPSVPTVQQPSPLNLPTQWALMASTEKSETFNVTAFGVNY